MAMSSSALGLPVHPLTFRLTLRSRAALCSKNQLAFKATHGELESVEIYVFYSEEASVGIKTMRK